MNKLNVVLLAVVVSVMSVMACHHHETSQKEVLQIAEKNDAEIAQKTCPVLGGEINEELFVEQDGKKIYVCCSGCIETVEKDFEKYLGIVEEAQKECETKESKAGGHQPVHCCASR